MAQSTGYLILENGTVFTGTLIGNHQPIFGEVVFNTSMTGYDQIISDPSYAGQIVVMTYPLIGNYGINQNHLESDNPWLRGLVLKELCPPSGCQHYEQELSLAEYIAENGIPCLTGVDTRALTRVIRTCGTMGGVIVDSLEGKDRFLYLAEKALIPPHEGFVKQVTCDRISHLGFGSRRIVVLDFGVKKSIITSLLKRECEVIVVPADTGARDILNLQPDGLVLSNGPGDPADCPYGVETISHLIGTVPIMGICLGHQLLALALGGKTYKMPFGHRGGNHPVKDLDSGRVYITAQNHSYAVDGSSLGGAGLEVAFRNLNDGSIEGMRYREMSLLSVQFHPEASPGPQDTHYIFDDFLSMTA